MNCIWYYGLYICRPRVGSWQASQNKLILFTLLLFVVKWRHNVNRKIGYIWLVTTGIGPIRAHRNRVILHAQGKTSMY